MNCLGFIKESKVVPTKNNLVEVVDYEFFLKLFLLHCHNNQWREKGRKPPTIVEIQAPPMTFVDNKENWHSNKNVIFNSTKAKARPT